MIVLLPLPEGAENIITFDKCDAYFDGNLKAKNIYVNSKLISLFNKRRC